MHAVISLLQSRKFWWYLLLTSSSLHPDVIITSYYCQRYSECLVTTYSSRTVYRHTALRTCNSWTAVSRNANLSCTQPVASKQPRSHFCIVDYEIWAVMQHRVNHRQIHSMDELKRWLIDVWCDLEQSIFDEAIDHCCVQVALWAWVRLPLLTTNIYTYYLDLRNVLRKYDLCDIILFLISLITFFDSEIITYIAQSQIAMAIDQKSRDDLLGCS